MDDIKKQIFESSKEFSVSKKLKAEILCQLQKSHHIDKDQAILRSYCFDLARKLLPEQPNVLVMEWLQDFVKILSDKTEDSNSKDEAYFSPGDECRNAIVRKIKEARNTIKICVFTISDDRLAKAILEAHHKGISIRIISDNDKCNDRGSDVYTLAADHIPIKIDHSYHHMHHKFAIVDNKCLITGSYNWTMSAAKYNQENIILTYNPDSIKAYSKEFDRLWCEMDEVKPLK